MAIHEECGVFGIYDRAGGCAENAYYGLYALQHRGQEACGIATMSDLNMRCRKDVGLVGDVFTRKLIAARDPWGFRPLCIGKRGDAWIFASESCALDSVGAEFVRDIVRGTTSSQLVKLLRDAGAKEVHMLSSAPMFIAPCYFGTDIPSEGELFACNHDLEEMQQLIGADSLGFLSVESLQKIAPNCTCGFCDGCFTEKYPIPMENSGED